MLCPRMIRTVLGVNGPVGVVCNICGTILVGLSVKIFIKIEILGRTGVKHDRVIMGVPSMLSQPNEIRFVLTAKSTQVI